MMQPDFLADKAVERILELSADLQIKRRATGRYSLAYHDFSVAIAAYGRVLDVLSTLQQPEEYSSTLGFLGSLEASREARPVL
ncbi:MAG TPA: hypothetical protein VN943_11250 [Candidatus Acidoferrum sp.]|nr:hypothetical protein [Candidatus Acidoferrum sp.]